MKTFIIAVALVVSALFLVALADDDAFVVQVQSVTIGNTNVYFPACLGDDDEGDCAEDLPANARFPALIFLQGGSVNGIYYSEFATKIAKEGYIVAVPSATPAFTNAKVAVSTKILLQQLDSDSTSGIYGRLEADNFVLGGHSLGGVAALLASSAQGPFYCQIIPALGCGGLTPFGSGLKAVITYGAATVTRRGGSVTILKLDSTLAPAIFVRGESDSIIRLDDHLATYNNLTNVSKAFIVVDDSNHYGITDVYPVPGATGEAILQAATQDWSTTKIAKAFLAGLKAFSNGSNGWVKKIFEKKNLSTKGLTVNSSQI